MGFCNCSMFCYVLLYFLSSFAIILVGKRELVVLLSLSSWCLIIVVWLFLVVPLVCLQFVIVVFPEYTHLLFCGSFVLGSCFVMQYFMSFLGLSSSRWYSECHVYVTLLCLFLAVPCVGGL